jgi:hypothetical protein
VVPAILRNSQQPDDKKETTSKKKKAAQKKKDVTTGIWPCKINGCNKQFAREADLKRHQRTTKLHSMPGFACPQCDATFTRTDAQRRHQKSRHNGVVIESPGQEKTDGTEEASSSNQSRSRSGTPSRKGKEKATCIPVETHQGTPNVGGPSSYYRSHTATMSTSQATLVTVASYSFMVQLMSLHNHDIPQLVYQRLQQGQHRTGSTPTTHQASWSL